MQVQINPTPKQHLAWSAFMDDNITDILFGGAAGGGKSYCACQMATVAAFELPGSTIGIARKEFTTLIKTTYMTLLEVFKDMGLTEKDWTFRGQPYNDITFTNGSKLLLLDVAYKPSDPNFDRLGGFLLTHAFGEEIAEWPQKAWEILQTRIGRNNKFIINGEEIEVVGKFFGTCNPTQNWVKNIYVRPQRDGTQKPFRVFIPALSADNPYLTKGYTERLENTADPITRRRLLLGDWDYEDAEGVLMKREYIYDIFSNTIVKSAEKYMVIDAAHMGGDRIVFNIWEGLESVKIEQFDRMDSQQIMMKAKELASEYKIPYSHIIVDQGGGYGNSVIDFMPGVVAFVGNSTPIDTRRALFSQSPALIHDKINRLSFATLKDQCGYKLAELINSHKIACKAQVDIESVVDEISQIRAKDPEKEGKLQLVPKSDIKTNLGRSPDISDTFLMRMWFELRKDIDASDVYAEGGIRTPSISRRFIRNAPKHI